MQKRQSIPYIAPLVVAIVVAVLIAVVLYGQIMQKQDATYDGARPSVLIDRPVPIFNAGLLADPSRIVDQDLLKGEVALVNFWGTWCPECYAEHEVLIELSQNVPVYGVNFNDNRNKALQWLNDYGNPFKASYFDPNGDVYLEWGVTGAPETFVIDSEGVIRYRHSGRLTAAVAEQVIMPLVAQLRKK